MRARRLLPPEYLVGVVPGTAAAAPSNGYDILIVEAGRELDFSPPTLSVGLVEAASVPFTVGADGTLYTVAVRARKGDLAGDPAEIVLKLVASGGQLVARPASPTGIRAVPTTGGDVVVTWQHLDDAANAVATAFHVYAGIGSVDYGTVLATATRYRRRVVLSGLQVDVQQLIAVRAVSAAGVEDGGFQLALCVARNDPPPAIAALTATQS